MKWNQGAKLLLRSAIAAALLGAASASSAGGVAAVEPADVIVAQTGAKSARISTILDRFTPVAQELGYNAGQWRESIAIQLSQASDAALAKLAEMDPTAVVKGTQANRSEMYKTFIATLGNDVSAKAMSKPGMEKVLGSVNIDQVYTPITPCRIVDTRNVGGPISAGFTRNFYFFSVVSSYDFGANQGGAAGAVGTVCPGVYFNPAAGTGSDANLPSAAAITITVVSPTDAGNWIVWGGANPIPTISALNWSGPGQILASTTIVPYGGRSGTGSGGPILDFAVRYNGPTGSAQFIADVVGYFSPPFGTALSCLETAQNNVAIGAGADGQVGPPACPAGYNNTAINCDTNLFSTFNAGFNINQCYWHASGGADTGHASRHCCRVDGR